MKKERNLPQEVTKSPFISKIPSLQQEASSKTTQTNVLLTPSVKSVQDICTINRELQVALMSASKEEWAGGPGDFPCSKTQAWFAMNMRVLISESTTG